MAQVRKTTHSRKTTGAREGGVEAGVRGARLGRSLPFVVPDKRSADPGSSNHREWFGEDLELPPFVATNHAGVWILSARSWRVSSRTTAEYEAIARSSGAKRLTRSEPYAP